MLQQTCRTRANVHLVTDAGSIWKLYCHLLHCTVPYIWQNDSPLYFRTRCGCGGSSTPVISLSLVLTLDMYVFIMTKFTAEPTTLTLCEISRIFSPAAWDPFPPSSQTDHFIKTVSDVKTRLLSSLRCAISIPTLHGFSSSWIPAAASQGQIS